MTDLSEPLNEAAVRSHYDVVALHGAHLDQEQLGDRLPLRAVRAASVERGEQLQALTEQAGTEAQW